MKKVILTSLFMLGLATLSVQAQTNTTTGSRGANSSTGASNGAAGNTTSNSGSGMSTTGGGMVSTGSADQDTGRMKKAKTNRRTDGSMQGDMNRKGRRMKKGDASMSSPMSTTSPQ